MLERLEAATLVKKYEIKLKTDNMLSSYSYSAPLTKGQLQALFIDEIQHIFNDIPNATTPHIDNLVQAFHLFQRIEQNSQLDNIQNDIIVSLDLLKSFLLKRAYPDRGNQYLNARFAIQADLMKEAKSHIETYWTTEQISDWRTTPTILKHAQRGFVGVLLEQSTVEAFLCDPNKTDDKLVITSLNGQLASLGVAAIIIEERTGAAPDPNTLKALDDGYDSVQR